MTSGARKNVEKLPEPVLDLARDIGTMLSEKPFALHERHKLVFEGNRQEFIRKVTKAKEVGEGVVEKALEFLNIEFGARIPKSE